MNDLELLDSLSHYYFQFGIFTKEGEQKVDVNVLNTDNTITTVKMKIAEVMYFTEYGTVTIPGQFILDKSLVYINRILNTDISLLVDRILEGYSNPTEIETTLKRVAEKAENYIRNFMKNTIKKNNILGNIINEGKDSNKYIYDLNNLSNYLHCILLKR